MGARQGFRRLKVLTLELEGSGCRFSGLGSCSGQVCFVEKRPSLGGTEPPERL